MTASSKAPRRLGGSDLSVFPVGLGLMSLSGAYGKSISEPRNGFVQAYDIRRL